MKKIISAILIIAIIIASLNIIPAKAATLDFVLTPHTSGYGSVSLDWSNYNYADKNFKVYKSSDGTNYQTVGIDYTLVEKVKVLNVYPVSSGTQIEYWMEHNGYGKGIIDVDTVYWGNFCSNPYGYLKDSSGNWKYDVLFFGTYDSNNNMDLNKNATNAIEAFIKTGRGCIFGHDILAWNSTISSSPDSYCKQLAPYFGLEYVAGGCTNYSDKVVITKKGLFTTYPWYIGEVGDVLNIPTSHNVGQYAKGDIWLKFYNPTTPTNYNTFLSTYNNCANIMTGHSNGAASVDEQKILANVIFYCNQLIFNTYHTKDSSAQDIVAPNIPTVVDNGITINYSSNDLGSKYYYYVESYSKDDTTSSGLIDRSAIKQIEVKTGLKSYRYIFDNSANTTVTLSNGTETTSTSITQPVNIKYFHVAAVDKAGNISATKTIELDPVWTVDTTIGTGGLITYDQTIEDGKSTSVYIIPMSGYQISSVTVDGTNKGIASVYDFWNISSSHTVVATFTKTTNLTNYLNTLKSKYSWITFK